MSRTYLHHCLKDDILCRWPDGAMPIRVYIAPFTWYEKKKQQESLVYRQMVLDALQEWSKASNQLIRFQVVDNLNQSQIDFKWRRVDRRSLGHCTYEIDPQHRLFTAEIQIGISDGMLHAAYQDANEVKHTIIHEIGHAMGLIGHSDHPDDIMYVPHQYGVFKLSERDIQTISWLYKLPVGFHYKNVGQKYKLPPNFSLNDVINKVEKRILGEEDSDATTPAFIEKVVSKTAPAASKTTDLDEQHQILSEMGRFYLKTQNIQINKHLQDQLKKGIIEKKFQKNQPPFSPEP